jgi:hypothetical protein
MGLSTPWLTPVGFEIRSMKSIRSTFVGQVYRVMSYNSPAC